MTSSISFSSAIQDINYCGTKVEQAFNFAGCIPLVSVVSGLVRIAAGKVQAVAGIVLFGVGLIGTAVVDVPYQHRYTKIKNLGKEHAIHGIYNMVRGLGEAIAGKTFLGLGSLFWLIPNLEQQKPFEPRWFKYGTYAK